MRNGAASPSGLAWLSGVERAVRRCLLPRQTKDGRGSLGKGHVTIRSNLVRGDRECKCAPRNCSAAGESRAWWSCTSCRGPCAKTGRLVAQGNVRPGTPKQAHPASARKGFLDDSLPCLVVSTSTRWPTRARNRFLDDQPLPCLSVIVRRHEIRQFRRQVGSQLLPGSSCGSRQAQVSDNRGRSRQATISSNLHGQTRRVHRALSSPAIGGRASERRRAGVSARRRRCEQLQKPIHPLLIFG